MKRAKVTLQSIVRNITYSINLHSVLFWNLACMISLLLFLKCSIHSFVSCVNFKKERNEGRMKGWEGGRKYLVTQV